MLYNYKYIVFAQPPAPRTPAGGFWAMTEPLGSALGGQNEPPRSHRGAFAAIPGQVHESVFRLLVISLQNIETATIIYGGCIDCRTGI